MNQNKNKKIISWKAPEFPAYEKGPGWIVALAIISALLIGYFLWQKDFLTAVLFLLFAVIIIVFSRKQPRNIEISLDFQGITVDRIQIPYKNIKYFWISEMHPMPTLYIETTAYINRSLSIMLHDQKANNVRKFLSRFLLEDPQREESLTDILSRRLRF